MKKKENKSPKKKLSPKALKALKITGYSAIGVVAALLVACLAVYFWLGDLYGNVNIERPNTEHQDLRSLAEIFNEDLDADVSNYPEDEVESARSSIVYNKIEMLPRMSYAEIVKALEADINADLSSYSLTKYECQVVRWAMIYHYDDLLLEITDTVSDESTFDPETTVEPGTETTEPETTVDPTTGTTEPETTVDPTTGTTEPETTVAPGTETTEPETTKPPETRPSDTGNPSVSTGVLGTEPPDVFTGTATDEDIYNVLIIGTDSRSNDLKGRTDTIIIASVNRVTKKIILSSIQRDTIVKDPELGGYAKINAFYARYAPNVGRRVGRLINAIKYNFDIDIHNYVVLDFTSFKDIIGVFGSVEVPVYYSEYLELQKLFPGRFTGLTGLYSNPKNSFITLALNPAEALSYARMRSNLYNPYLGAYQRSDDSYRTERQRNVIHAIIRQVRTLTMGQLVELSEKIFPYITTDLDYNAFLLKLSGYLDFAKYSVKSINLSRVKYSWYPCTTDGYVVYYQGDKGYGTGYQGVGILEPQPDRGYNYTDGYALIKKAWRDAVYK